MKICLCATALVLALVLPAAAEDQCPPLKMVASVDLVPSPDGRQEYVPVEIAGVPKLMLLDTGAEPSLLTGKAADELKLTIFKANSEAYDITGAKVDRFTTAEVKLGSMKGNLKLMVAPNFDRLSDNPRVAGILGTDVLSNFDLSIDFTANKLDLIDKNHCDGKVRYWPATAMAVVPFEDWHVGKIVIGVVLDGKKLKAIVDTGAELSTLHIDTAEILFGIHPGSADAPEADSLNERADLKTYRHVFKTLDFNGISVLNPDFQLIPDKMSKKLAPDTPLGTNIRPTDDAVSAPILIGMNVLKKLHVYIAYKEKKLYITPASAPPSR